MANGGTELKLISKVKRDMRFTIRPSNRSRRTNPYRLAPKPAFGSGTPVRFAAIVATVFASSFSARAQSLPAAVQRLQLSAFGGVSGVYTGLGSGRNLAVTAGVDLGLPPIFSLSPTLEVRGSYAIDKGKVDSQKNIMGGVTVAKDFGRVRPYGDVFVGRGQINYGNGYVNPAGNLRYLQTNSNVFATGGGLDLRLDRHFAIKLDAQIERYASPVTVSGHLYAKAVTVGMVYHFRFGSVSPR